MAVEPHETVQQECRMVHLFFNPNTQPRFPEFDFGHLLGGVRTPCTRLPKQAPHAYRGPRATQPRSRPTPDFLHVPARHPHAQSRGAHKNPCVSAANPQAARGGRAKVEVS